MKHLNGGLEVLNNWKRESSAAEDRESNEHNELVAVFSRLDLQATLFDDDRLPMLQFADDYTTQAMLRSPDDVECSLRQLYESIFLYKHEGFTFLIRSVSYKAMGIRYIPPAVLKKRKQLLACLESWRGKAEEYEHRELSATIVSPTNQEDRKTFAVCQLHYSIMRLLLLHSLPDEVKANAPSFDDEANFLLDAARAALSPSGSDGSSNSSKRYYSLQLGIVPPMFLLALKVADPSTRKAAIQVLRDAEGLREGFSDARMLASLVENVQSRVPSAEYRERYVALEWIAEDARILALRSRDGDDGEFSYHTAVLSPCGVPRASVSSGS